MLKKHRNNVFNQDLFLYFPVPIFSSSRYGKPVIQIGQYRFNKYCRSKGPKARWLCVKARSGCPASLITVEDLIIKANSNHLH